MIGGSPAGIRADASRVRHWASATEDDARRALDASQVDWESTAAQRWRESLRDQLTDVTATASAMRDVAADIDRLADTLEDRQNRLASLLEHAGRTVNDVRDALVDGATDALDVAQGFADDAADVARDLADGAGDAVRDLGRGVAGVFR